MQTLERAWNAFELKEMQWIYLANNGENKTKKKNLNKS